MPEVKSVSTIEDDSIGIDYDTKIMYLGSDDDRNSIMNLNNSFTGVPIIDTQLKQVLNKTYFYDKSAAAGRKDDNNQNKNHKKNKRKANNKRVKIEIDKIESNHKKDERKDSSNKIIYDENKIKQFENKVEDKEKEKKKDEENENEKEKEKEKNIDEEKEEEKKKDIDEEKEEEKKKDIDEENCFNKNESNKDIVNEIVGNQADDNGCEIEDICHGGNETMKKITEINEIDSSKETIEISGENVSKIVLNDDESEENGIHLNEMIYNEIQKLDLKSEENEKQETSEERTIHRGEKKKKEGRNNGHGEKDVIIGPTEFKQKKSKKARKHRKKKKIITSIEPIKEHIEEFKAELNESKSLRSLSPFKFKDNLSTPNKNNEENSSVNQSINEDKNDKFAIETLESGYAIDICDQITFNSPIKDLEINSEDNFETNDNEKCDENLKEKNEIISVNDENIEANDVYEPFCYNSSHLDDENYHNKEKIKKKRKRNNWLHNWFRKIDTSKDEDFELKEVFIDENSRSGTGSYMLQQIRENLKQMFLFEKRQALTEEKLKSLEDSVKRQNQEEGPKMKEKDCIMMMGEEKGTIIKKVIEGRVLIIENQPLMDRLKPQGKRADKELKNQLVKYIKMGDIFIFDNVEGKKYITIDISNVKS